MQTLPVVVSAKVIIVDMVVCVAGSVGSATVVVSSSVGEVESAEETSTFSVVMRDVICSVEGTADDEPSKEERLSSDVLGSMLFVLVSELSCVELSSCSAFAPLAHLADTWNRTARGKTEKLPSFRIRASAE